MASQRSCTNKGRLSFRRLICSSNRDKEQDDENDSFEREGPLGFAQVGDDLGYENPSFEDIYNERTLDLDDSVYSFDVTPQLLRKSNSAKGDTEESTRRSILKSAKKPTRQSKPAPPRRTKSGTVPKRWHGDGGEDQPVQSSPQRKGELPSMVSSTDSGSSSPDFVADVLAFDDTESLGNSSLIRRVELVKARAEHLLMEARKKKKPSPRSGASVKSVASSVVTEPTMEVTFSSSTRSSDTICERIKRLQEAKSKLQRFSDDYSETSTIRTDSINRVRRYPSTFHRSNGSVLDSSDDESIPEGSKSAAESGDVLHIISMLEAINGYDLSVNENTLDESTIFDLDLSFLKS